MGVSWRLARSPDVYKRQQLARSSFMQEVNRGIEKAAVELKEKGIQLILKEGLSVDEEEQLQAIEELEQEGIRGRCV